mgnify:CR=1 FL=1
MDEANQLDDLLHQGGDDSRADQLEAQATQLYDEADQLADQATQLNEEADQLMVQAQQLAAHQLAAQLPRLKLTKNPLKLAALLHHKVSIDPFLQMKPWN